MLVGSTRLFGLQMLLALFGCLLHHQTLAQVAEETTAATTNITTTNTELVLITNPYLQEHVDRFFDILNGVEDIYNETEYANRFTPLFVEQLPLETAFLPVLQNLQVTADTWEILQVMFDETSNPNAVVLLIAPQDTGEPKLLMSMSVDPSTNNHQVNGLRFQPAEMPTLENPPHTVQEAVDQLRALGHQFHYLIADVDHSPSSSYPKCSNVLAGENIDSPAPLGSMFKLWVLGAVVDAIQAKTVSWDQLVLVREQDKSLPSGIVQDDPPGSNRTVRELAELMISISDNTATDLLINLVGRTNIEEITLKAYGHSNPKLNIPFLKTKEIFILKLDGAKGDGKPGPLGQEYIHAAAGDDDDEKGQRNILATLQNTTISSYNLNPITAWEGGPIAIEEIEWFGSPLDLCNVMVRLVQNQEAARILSINPGIPDSQGLWSYIGYKGGSEPGVLGMAWYLIPASNSTETGDVGHHRIVTGSLWDPTTAINEMQATLLMGQLRGLSLGENLTANTTTTLDPEEEEEGNSSSSAAAMCLFILPVLSSSGAVLLLFSLLV